MSKNTTYLVTLANTKDGAVHGHKAGCADLKRSKAYALHRDEQFEVEVTSKREAWLDYNADFIAEGGEDNAYPVEWFACAKHVPEGQAEEPVAAASTADEAAAGEFTAEPADEPEFAADATKDWQGNYNTVFAPAAELIAAGFPGVEVRTVNVSTMLRQTDVAGANAKEFLDLLVAIEAAALAAMKAWQKTLDRKDASDMEKFNQNRSFLAGYLASAARRMTGAKKMPVVAFAKDMDRALRADALKAGAAAHKDAA
jgi:hypothetical protein